MRRREKPGASLRVSDLLNRDSVLLHADMDDPLEALDVLVELCDRIMVIGSGRVTGIVDGRTATKEEIGWLERMVRDG